MTKENEVKLENYTIYSGDIGDEVVKFEDANKVVKALQKRLKEKEIEVILLEKNKALKTAVRGQLVKERNSVQDKLNKAIEVMESISFNPFCSECQDTKQCVDKVLKEVEK